MTEVPSAPVLVGRGIASENRKPGKREVTLLSAEAWAHACSELGVVLAWYTRRANLLIERLDLSTTVGRTITVGPVRLAVHGETKPCGIMDQQHGGLRKALTPPFRGGVYAQVLTGGVIHVGDPVCLEEL
jgi:MOSC domain-containing protein YiiM